MSIKKKITKSIRRISQLLRRNRMVFVAAIIALIVCLAIGANISVIQMFYYTTLTQDTPNVIVLLERNLGKSGRQGDIEFETGINYLIGDLTEEGKAFLEENFLFFTAEIKATIINAYNEKGMTFVQSQDVFQVAALLEEMGPYQAYIQRLSAEEIERTLKVFVGESPKLTQDIVSQLYKILSQQKSKVSNDLLKLDVYELISFPHDGDMESTSLKLLGYIEDEAIREGLFSRLKTEPIDVDVFSTWIDILNKKKIITTQEYAQFTTGYGNIRRLQGEYAQAVNQEVELINIKDKIDSETQGIEREMATRITEVDELKVKLASVEEQLVILQNYQAMDFYILDKFQNGDYEASTPVRSWLGNSFKPGNDRIRLKITGTTVEGMGVVTVDVYNGGTSTDGDPYFVEVSPKNYADINTLKENEQHFSESVRVKEEQIAKSKEEIEQIRKTNNYEQTLNSLDEVVDSKERLLLEIRKEQVEIQNLFQIGELVIEVKK